MAKRVESTTVRPWDAKMDAMLEIQLWSVKRVGG